MVDASRTEAPGKTLPFGETAEKALSYAGVKSSVGDQPDCLARLSIEAEMSALSGVYSSDMSSFAGARTAYTGARIRVEMTFSARDRREKVQFTVEKEPDFSVSGGTSASKPSDAPFDFLYFAEVEPRMLRFLAYATQPTLLVNAIQDTAGGSDHRFRRASLEAARGTQEPAVVQCLAEALLRETDARERKRIVNVLKDARTTGAADILIGALHAGNAEERARAADALGAIADARAVDALLGCLRDQNAEVLNACVSSLGQWGDARAVEPVTALLQHADPGVRAKSAEALGRLGDARAGAALVSALSDKERRVQVAAMTSIGMLRYRGAVRALVGLFLRDTEAAELRSLAAFVLDKITDTATNKLPATKRVEIWLRSPITQRADTSPLSAPP